MTSVEDTIVWDFLSPLQTPPSPLQTPKRNRTQLLFSSFDESFDDFQLDLPTDLGITPPTNLPDLSLPPLCRSFSLSPSSSSSLFSSTYSKENEPTEGDSKEKRKRDCKKKREEGHGHSIHSMITRMKSKNRISSQINGGDRIGQSNR
jgi:hypothetical protein